MAEYCGGVCSISPVNCGSSARIASAEGLSVAYLGDLALGVVGVALLAPGDRKAVALAAVHHERNRLGGLAQRDRQAAGGQRIERAGMSRAFCGKQPLHHRNRMGRGHADRLVENDPAMDVALVAAGLLALAAACRRSDRGCRAGRCFPARARAESEKLFFSAPFNSSFCGSMALVGIVTAIMCRPILA